MPSAPGSRQHSVLLLKILVKGAEISGAGLSGNLLDGSIRLFQQHCRMLDPFPDLELLEAQPGHLFQECSHIFWVIPEMLRQLGQSTAGGGQSGFPFLQLLYVHSFHQQPGL